MKNMTAIEQIRLSDEAIKYDTHFHNSYEMILVMSGMVRICFNRGKVYEAKPGSLIFISNLEEHSTKVLEEPYKRYFINLFPPDFDKLIGEPQLLSVFKNRPPSFCHVFDISAISKKVIKIFSSLYSESHSRNEFSAKMTDCLLFELLVSVYRNNRESFPAPSESIPSQIYSVQKYIENNFRQPISLKDLAERHFISMSHLSHNFKRLTGYSPMQYVQLNRLSYSRNMLSSTDLPVSEVAYRSGFADVNNFIRKFKSYHGYTPGNVRKVRRSD